MEEKHPLCPQEIIFISQTLARYEVSYGVLLSTAEQLRGEFEFFKWFHKGCSVLGFERAFYRARVEQFSEELRSESFVRVQCFFLARNVLHRMLRREAECLPTFQRVFDRVPLRVGNSRSIRRSRIFCVEAEWNTLAGLPRCRVATEFRG